MKPKPGRDTPILRREREEMTRAHCVQTEMASAVRVLGGEGSAKECTNRAARAAGLPATIIERLRWKKIKRPFADIVDQIREAVDRHNRVGLLRVEHELKIAEALNRRLVAELQNFMGVEADQLRERPSDAGAGTDYCREGNDPKGP